MSDCKIAMIIRDLLNGGKQREDFVVIVDGKSYDIKASLNHKFLSKKLRGIHITVERSKNE